VEEVAQDHLKEILAVQPQGPYYLGGYSFGGLLALEVAKVLRARGESVIMLALFDPAAPPLPRSEFPPRARQEQLRLLPQVLLRAALWLPLEIRRQVRRLVLRVAEQIVLMLGKPLPNRLRFARHGRLYSRAAHNYRYGTYDGYTLLFAPRVDARDLEIMTRRWRRVIPKDLEVHSVWTATRHGDLFEEPSMTYVTRQINRILSDKGLGQSEPTVALAEQTTETRTRHLPQPLKSTKLENTA
jgi:thioesterase domain-containing protein